MYLQIGISIRKSRIDTREKKHQGQPLISYNPCCGDPCVFYQLSDSDVQRSGLSRSIFTYYRNCFLYLPQRCRRLYFRGNGHPPRHFHSKQCPAYQLSLPRSHSALQIHRGRRPRHDRRRHGAAFHPPVRKLRLVAAPSCAHISIDITAGQIQSICTG